MFLFSKTWLIAYIYLFILEIVIYFFSTNF